MEWIANVEMAELKNPLSKEMFKPKYPKSVPEPFQQEEQWGWKCPICGKIPFSDTLITDDGKIAVNSLPDRFTKEFAQTIQAAVEEVKDEPIFADPIETFDPNDYTAPEQEIFQCEECGKQFDSKIKLHGHMISHKRKTRIKAL